MAIHFNYYKIDVSRTVRVAYHKKILNKHYSLKLLPLFIVRRYVNYQ